MSQIPHPHPLVKSLDQAIVEDHAEKESPFRNHMGGSMIGRPCEREIWYGFRWSKIETFGGRMLRLFGRGHLEEFRFVAYLKLLGINVRAYSERLCYHPGKDEYMTFEWEASLNNLPDGWAESLDVTDEAAHVARAAERGVKLKQWRISDVDGHFGGSLDAIMDAPFEVQLTDGSGVIPAGEEFLGEFKTHNTKSFGDLIAKKSVKEAKPVHWKQMQTYMKKKGLRFGLYMAVNKNDDDIYIEVIACEPLEGEALIEKATRLVHLKQPPNRVGKHESWFECKFCSYKGICHRGEPLLKNCRTCVHSCPAQDGEWYCGHWQSIIPGDAVMAGCDNYKMITD